MTKRPCSPTVALLLTTTLLRTVRLDFRTRAARRHLCSDRLIRSGPVRPVFVNVDGPFSYEKKNQFSRLAAFSPWPMITTCRFKHYSLLITVRIPTNNLNLDSFEFVLDSY